LISGNLNIVFVISKYFYYNNLSAFSGATKVLIVNINTMRKNADSTCTLNVGDHPFIRHESFVNYANSALVSVEKLEDSLSTGRAEYREALKEKVLKRIRQCLLVSPHTPFDVRNIWLKIMKNYD